MKKRTKQNGAQSMNRTFLIAKVFLAITPIIAYCYISMIGTMKGISFQEVLVQEANITIVFLIAMLNPYIAYLISLIQKKLEAKDDTFAMINMLLLMIAQALTMNVFYLVMLFYVFYKAIHYYHVDIRSTFTSMNLKQGLWCGGGSFLVMMVSSLCLFATIRLM